MFVPIDSIFRLDMSVEQAAKLVISAGLVVPDHKAGGTKQGDKVPEITEDAAQRLIDRHSKKTEKV